jgi:hypothetical protein
MRMTVARIIGGWAVYRGSGEKLASGFADLEQLKRWVVGFCGLNGYPLPTFTDSDRRAV